MEVYENINTILKNRGETKRWFAKRLRELEPKLERTGEIPTEKAIYGYLNGASQLKIELVPYICEVLNINETQLFHLENLKNNSGVSNQKKEKITDDKFDNEMQKLISLLPYASKPMINKLIKELERTKTFCEKI